MGVPPGNGSVAGRAHEADEATFGSVPAISQGDATPSIARALDPNEPVQAARRHADLSRARSKRSAGTLEELK